MSSVISVVERKRGMNQTHLADTGQHVDCGSEITDMENRQC